MTRIYGRTSTHLRLTAKAEHYYSGTDPLTIIEHESCDENGDTLYSYSIKEPEWGLTIPVSQDAINEWLEAMDDITAEEDG